MQEDQESRCIFVSIPLNLSIVRRVDSVGLCTLYDMECSYTKLSCDIPWNIPLATCVFLAYSTHEPLGEYEYEENTTERFVGYSMAMCTTQSKAIWH